MNTSLPAPTVGHAPRSQSDVAIGVLLIVIGLAVAAAWAVPDAGAYAPLVVGLACLAMFALTRAYGLAVPGGIVTGVGLGVVLTSQAGVDGSWLLVAMAAGFASIYPMGFLARPAVTTAWSLIPAAILAMVGLAALTGREADLPWAQVAGAAILIAIGAALILRARVLRS